LKSAERIRRHLREYELVIAEREVARLDAERREIDRRHRVAAIRMQEARERAAAAREAERMTETESQVLLAA
jgi:hypothetical protein